MPFKKGQSGNPEGLKPGSKNQKTKQWEKFASWFMDKGMSRLEEEIGKLEGKEYVYVVKDMLEYFQPKLSRSEIEANIVDKIIVKRPTRE